MVHVQGINRCLCDCPNGAYYPYYDEENSLHDNFFGAYLFARSIRGFAAKDFIGMRGFCARIRAHKIHAYQILFPEAMTCLMEWMRFVGQMNVM